MKIVKKKKKRVYKHIKVESLLNSSFYYEFLQYQKKNLPTFSILLLLLLLLLHSHSKPPEHEINQFDPQQEIHHHFQLGLISFPLFTHQMKHKIFYVLLHFLITFTILNTFGFMVYRIEWRINLSKTKRHSLFEFRSSKLIRMRKTFMLFRYMIFSIGVI